MTRRAPAPGPFLPLFDYFASHPAAAPSPAPQVPSPPPVRPHASVAVQAILARARALASRAAVAPRITRPDGVVPLTTREAVQWCREHALEWPDEVGVEFKLGVRFANVENSLGGVVAVCLGVRPLAPEPPGTLELAVVAIPHAALRDATPVALDRGARAALAMGYTRIIYHRLPEIGHAYDRFAPLDPPPYRDATGANLPWRKDGFVEARPWLRHVRAEKTQARRVRDLRDRQVDAILEWEDALEAREDALGRPLEEEDESALAAELGYDYYEGWRPHEFTDVDAADWLDATHHGLVERLVLEVPPSPKTLFIRKITRDEANAVLPRWHSHLPETVKGHLFSLGVYAREAPGVYPEHLRAVCVVSMPVAQAFTKKKGDPSRPGDIVEVVRVAVNREAPPLVGAGVRPDGRPHTSNEASFVLKRAEEACVALGFNRIVSSILLGEAGASYRSAGWKAVAVGRGGEWDREGRARKKATQPGWKVRFEVGPGAATPVIDPKGGTVEALVKDAAELAKVGEFPLGGAIPAHAPSAPAGSAGTLPNPPPEPAAWLYALFARERARFLARYPCAELARADLRIVNAPCSGAAGRHCAWRDVAWCAWDPGRWGRVFFLARALTLPRANLIGLLRHELGHLADPHKGTPDAEARADRIARAVTGVAIRYDARDLQTVGPGRAARPPHLHR